MGVPTELQQVPQWLVWKLIKRGKDKPTKVPVNAATGKVSDAHNPESWASYADALAAAPKYSGLGFVFTANDPYCGIDLDHCRDKATGFIESWAWAIIKELDSYTEVSPSGTGVHIIVKGHAFDRMKTAIPGTDSAIEIYDKGRFFTVTGKHLDGTPDGVEVAQDALDAVYARYFPAEPVMQRAAPSMPTGDVVAIIQQSAQAAKFARLMAGDASEYRKADGTPDESSADSALCAMLAFYTKDASEIERIWGQSALAQRDKWQRQDYRDRTIVNALKLIGDAQYVPSNGALALTDMGNAERLVRRHGSKIRFCYEWGKWLVWDGKRWKTDDDAAITRLAKETVRSIYTEAAACEDGEKAKKIAAWSTKSQSLASLRAMIELAKSETSIMSDALDSDSWLLNVQNGTLDLRTGAMRPHNASDYITKIAKVGYDADALAPEWLRFIDWAMRGDAELGNYLQKALGYGLTGDCSEHAIFIPYGQGKNGKSTLFGAVQEVLGDYADSLRPESLMLKHGDGGIPNDIAALKGQRFIVSSEGEEGQRLAESLIKMLTGGDMVRARFLRAEFFTFRPTHKIFFFTNKKPVIRGTDEGIWRRIHLIPFDATVTQADKHLPEKLQKEASGILNWLLAGCLDWQKNGLVMPQRVLDATGAYRDEMDVLQGFLHECCFSHDAAKASATELYNAYKAWCEECGEKPRPQRVFGIMLGDRGYTKAYVHGGKAAWKGVKIREEGDDLPTVVVRDGIGGEGKEAISGSKLGTQSLVEYNGSFPHQSSSSLTNEENNPEKTPIQRLVKTCLFSGSTCAGKVSHIYPGGYVCEHHWQVLSLTQGVQ